MVRIERAEEGDAELFASWEQASGTIDYILPYSFHEHVRTMRDPNVVYLRILNDDRIVGFFILALDGGASVEFRRIVISSEERGVGQQAIRAMERFAREQLQRSRIWLDVFEHNGRARHIYEKLGYLQYGESDHAGRTLLLYEKEL